MQEKTFHIKDYWSLFKLSCRSYIYKAPFYYRARPFIAAYVIYSCLSGTLKCLLEHPFNVVGYLFMDAIVFFAIINPYFLEYALHYKSSDWYNNTGYLPSDVCEDVGLFGEYHATIDYSCYKGKYGKIYNGLIVPKPQGSFTELDLVIVSEYMIAVVEAKAREGVFSGHILDDTWTQRIGPQVNELQNPVLQNQNHINYLRLYLKEHAFNPKDNTCVNIGIEFGNIVYLALAKGLNIQGDSPLFLLDILRSKPRNKSKLEPVFDPADVATIIDRLDQLPTYTPEEKALMFTKREAQYRNGEFIHTIIYYPIRFPDNVSTICMDGHYYKFLLCDDGFWRIDIDFMHPIEIAEFGKPCRSVQDAVMEKKRLGW